MSAWQQVQRERQARFWELIRQGKTNTAACEAVGVERHQGYRWRKAAGGRIPSAPRVVSGRFLSLEERLAIAGLHLAGQGVRVIAAAVGRCPVDNQPRAGPATAPDRRPASALSVAGRAGAGNYAPYAAHKRAQLRARRSHRAKLSSTGRWQTSPADKLAHTWSPEQIRDELARAFPGQAEMQVSHESIYQALYVQGRGQLRADLHKQLRTGRTVRRPRGTSTAAKATLTDVISIRERPAEAADRAVPGHGEGDLLLESNSPLGDRHPGGALHPLRAARRPARRARRPSRARRPRPGHRHPAYPAAPLADLRPRHRTGPPPRHHPGHRPRAAGGSFDDVAKLTIYLVDWSGDKMAALGAGVARAADQLGVDPVKPVTLIPVAALGEPDLLVEVDAIAVLD